MTRRCRRAITYMSGVATAYPGAKPAVVVINSICVIFCLPASGYMEG